jgi:1-phosphatidylinositol-4-phosphate 5-kinase
LTLDDGTRLEGEWRSDSKFSGSGTIYYPNGDHYAGEWNNLIPHKAGKMMYKQGKTYYGEWHRGLMHGVGTLEYANGDVYQG